VSEIRKLISRWYRNEPGAERNAARRKCSKALAPILDIDAAPSLSHLWKLRALCWVLRRLYLAAILAIGAALCWASSGHAAVPRYCASVDGACWYSHELKDCTEKDNRICSAAKAAKAAKYLRKHRPGTR
jgi:hypothetical protein